MWRDHSIRITRGGTTQSELHGAGSLNQNYTGRDHSIRITRGGSTQSELHGAGPLSQTRCLKGPIPTGVTLGAGSLNQNSAGRDHLVRIPFGGNTHSDIVPENLAKIMASDWSRA